MWLLVFLNFVQNGHSQLILEWEESFSNLDNWEFSYEIGSSNFNGEWQQYTSQQDNVFIREDNQKNSVVIRAIHQEYQDYHITSGELISKQKFGPGRFFNVRAKVPKGHAIWPGIKLLPYPGISKYGPWASCGEIAIMETICEGNDAYATLRFGEPRPNQSSAPQYNHYNRVIDWNQPHNFGVYWEADKISFYYDAEVDNGNINGDLISTVSSDEWFAYSEGVYYESPAPFDQEFNIILNVAVGGDWACKHCCAGGKGSADLPAEMEVFSVKVYTDESRINWE